jgi:DNA modification methylase
MAERSEAWAHVKQNKGWRAPPSGYKDKDLVGVPWMLAFAMRAEGWYLRQCNIWAKPNCMPESVSDRSTAAHEYVFHFSKNNDYWYDNEAARTPPSPATLTQLAAPYEGKSTKNHKAAGVQDASEVKRRIVEKMRRTDKQRGHSRKHEGFNDRWDEMEKQQQQHGANLRSVWWISPAQYRDSHYAVMPDTLAEICIAAGCPRGGVVLDPFGGAGTTGLMADRMGRDAILIELNPEYAAMARRRITGDAPLLAEVTA